MRKNYILTDDINTVIKKIAIPSSIGMFFNTMYNAVDNFFAGLISTKAVAAISLSYMIFFLITVFAYSFSIGISSLIGNALGKNKIFLASLYAKKSLIFTFIGAIIVTILGLIFSSDLLKLLGAKKDYLDIASDYINIILLGNIFFSLNFCLNSILLAKGDTKTYRNTLILGFFLNIALNPLFIYGFIFIPPMGIQGIAISTLLIYIINFIYILKKTINTGFIDFKNLYYYKPDLRVYKDFIKQGLPSCLNMTTMAIGSLIIMYFVSKYGYKAVAGYGISFRIEQMFLLLALGLNSAVLSIVSNNFGAKQYNRIKLCLEKILLYGFIISILGIIFLSIFGKYLIKIFDNDINVINYGYSYLLVEVWVFFAYIVIFVCVSTLQGIKTPKVIPYVSFYRQILAPYILFYIIVNYLKLNIIYLWVGIMVITYSAAIFIGIYTYKKLNTYIKF